MHQFFLDSYRKLVEQERARNDFRTFERLPVCARAEFTGWKHGVKLREVHIDRKTKQEVEPDYSKALTGLRRVIRVSIDTHRDEHLVQVYSTCIDECYSLGRGDPGSLHLAIYESVKRPGEYWSAETVHDDCGQPMDEDERTFHRVVIRPVTNLRFVPLIPELRVEPENYVNESYIISE